MEEIITLSGNNTRLDVLLSADGSLTRSRAAALIKDGHVTVNGKPETRSSVKPGPGDSVVLTLPPLKETENKAEAIPLEILYQDEHIAVIVKPCGMVTHPAPGNEDGTLVNALLFHLSSLSGIGGEKRPGIIHRLDKDTSGVMLIAKDDTSHAFLARELADRHMEKHYHAMVLGHMKEPQGTVDAPIARSKNDRKKMAIDPDGRYALTEWTVMKELPDRTLLDVHIITGRTHQIRVHMRSIGHPVLGDPIYGVRNMPKASRLMLHAYSLTFTHPTTGERMTFTAPCPFD